MLPKSSFLFPHLFCNREFKILILEIEMLLELQNKTNIEIVGF